jgi:hypothetical protein
MIASEEVFAAIAVEESILFQVLSPECAPTLARARRRCDRTVPPSAWFFHTARFTPKRASTSLKRESPRGYDSRRTELKRLSLAKVARGIHSPSQRFDFAATAPQDSKSFRLPHLRSSPLQITVSYAVVEGELVGPDWR